jgi:1-acyl-sn-glycerol-3-phosphate acyltransferase
MYNYIKTPITLTAWFCISLFFTLLCIPLTFIPAPTRYHNRFYFFLTTIWTKLLMLFSFTYVKKQGVKNLPTYPNSPAIIIANHTSSIDIFLLESLIGTYPHIWLSKAEYLSIPLFSILIKRMHIPVKRENSLQAARALIKAYKQAKEAGSHILMFPEGKRYQDGKVHEFNSGFALLAKKLQRPVIPISITGLHKIFPKGTFLINYEEVIYAARPTLIVGKPFMIKKDESVEHFSKRIRDWFTYSYRMK